MTSLGIPEFPYDVYKAIEEAGAAWVRKQDSTVVAGRRLSGVLTEASRVEQPGTGEAVKRVAETLFAIEADRQASADALLEAVFGVGAVSTLAKDATRDAKQRDKLDTKMRTLQRKASTAADLASTRAACALAGEAAVGGGARLVAARADAWEHFSRVFVHSQMRFHAAALQQLTQLAGEMGVDPSASVDTFARGIRGYDAVRPAADIINENAGHALLRTAGTIISGDLPKNSR